MALYEAVFITRQDLAAEAVDSISDKLSKIITDKKGKVVAKEYWGLRNLAYKISKNPRGHYVSLSIESENDGIEELRRVSGLSEDIIRSNIFQVKKHSAEPSALMVSDVAKNYNPSEAGKVKKSENRKVFDAQVEQIVINV